MPTTYQQHLGVTGQLTYTVPFPYLNPLHVGVYVNGVKYNRYFNYDFTPTGQIEFYNPFVPAEGALIEFRRDTPTAPLVNYQNAATLTADDLNTATKQALYVAEELKDRYDAILTEGLNHIVDGNYVTPSEAIDAAAQAVLNSTLLAALQAQISDYNANGESIIAINSTLLDVQAQINALGTINTSGIGTLITNEQNARIAGDNALASDLALIGAKSGDNTAWILDLNKVRVGPTESLGTRLSALSTADSNASAAIVSEQNARVSADNSLASSITTLQSTIGSNSAAISTLQTVTNGLAAQYMVKLDVNGYVSGFGLYNAAGSSQFIVLADKFAVVTPGGTPKVPFSIVGGVVYANDLVVKNANIENLSVGKVTSGTLTATITQNADWSVGTGRIVYDSNPGTSVGVVRISGSGFGPSNQYLEWFGPKPAGQSTIAGIVANISDAAAVQYLKTNGDAYFGGSLSAGVLRNAATSTSLVTNPEVTVGPFASNGGSKTVVVSYSMTDSVSQMNLGGGSGTNTGTVTVYRTIGTGSEAVWTTFDVAGTWQTTDEAPGLDPGHGTSNMSGTITLTDTTSPTADRTYRAKLTSASYVGWGSPSSQKLTVVSTEE